MRIGMKVTPLSVLRAGIANYVLNLVRGIAEAGGHELVLYTNRDLPEDVDLPECAEVVSVTRPSPAMQLWFHLGLPPRMRRDRIDLYHDPVYPLPLGRMPVPGVITVHDLSNYTHRQTHTGRAGLGGRLLPLYVRRARLIIAVSDYTAAEIARLFPAQAGKVRVVPNGVEHDLMRPAPAREVERVRERYGLPERFCLFLGTLEPRKNLPRLLRAFDGLTGRIPHSLVIAGGRGWKCRELVSRMEGSERVLATGFIPGEDLPALLSAAEMLVYPSLLEGFGLPVLESMACGTPVITSNVSSMPEVAGGAALLVDPSSEEELASAVLRMATDPALRSDLSSKGIERAAGFTWERTVRMTLEVYREALTPP